MKSGVQIDQIKQCQSLKIVLQTLLYFHNLVKQFVIEIKYIKNQ